MNISNKQITDNINSSDTEESVINSECSEKPFWQRIIEMGAEVPQEEWQKLPRDFARNAESYIYDTSKDDEKE